MNKKPLRIIARLVWILAFIANISLALELKTITPESFLAENPSPERKEIIDFMVHQFDSKRISGVTQAQLDQVWQNNELKNNFRMARFQIIDQKLYTESFDVCHYYFILLEYFQKLVKNYKIKDVDFIIYLREGMDNSDFILNIKQASNASKELLNVPAFIMFQDLNSPYETDKFLFPDANFLKNDWQALINRIEHQTKDTPWGNKLNKLFWRGRATEGIYNLANFDKLIRIKLTMLSKLYPGYIDAAYSPTASPFPEDKSGKAMQKIFNYLLVGTKAVNEEEHLKYKYLASIDGNSATGTRVPWIMLSSSILVKQTSSKIEWFYTALKPYVHYVPVNERLTDIFTQIEWMQNHDQELQEISVNAHNFVNNNLLPEDIDSHVVLLLNEYHSIQKDKQIIATLQPADEALSFTALIKIMANKFIRKVKSWL